MRKSFKVNKEGKIEFTKEELKKILDEVYNEGFNDCKNEYYIYNTPLRWDYWWNSTTTAPIQTITSSNTNPLVINYKEHFNYTSIADDCIYSNEVS